MNSTICSLYINQTEPNRARTDCPENGAEVGNMATPGVSMWAVHGFLGPVGEGGGWSSAGFRKSGRSV